MARVDHPRDAKQRLADVRHPELGGARLGSSRHLPHEGPLALVSHAVARGGLLGDRPTRTLARWVVRARATQQRRGRRERADAHTQDA
eukprot:511480-Pyramimonas_sp.AAC.1